jgi:hypothetical protein
MTFVVDSMDYGCEEGPIQDKKFLVSKPQSLFRSKFAFSYLKDK